MNIIVNTVSAVISNYKGYDAFVDYNDNVWLGLQKNYDNHGHYNNSDNSLIFISENDKMYSFLYSSGWVLSQEEMINNGCFTQKLINEFINIENTILKNLIKKTQIKFIDKIPYSA